MLPVATRSSPAPAAAAPDGGGGSAGMDAGAGVISGYFAVFGEWANIGGAFLERNAPDAFTSSIARDRARIRAIFQHGLDPTAGLKPLGRILTLRGDGFYEIEPLSVQYVAELLPGLRAGLFGASYKFAPVRVDVQRRPGRSDHNPDGLPEVTVLEARLIEFGPVTFGAYTGATARLA